MTKYINYVLKSIAFVKGKYMGKNLREESNQMSQLELAKRIIMAEQIDLGADILEVGLDQLLEEGIIKDIPILGSVVKAGKIVSTIHDAIFVKKVIAFAQNIHSGSGNEEKWNQHKEKLLSDQKRLIKEIEVLLIYIDRYTKYLKSKILGKFYILYVKEELDWSDFEVFAEILDDISVYDFETLEELFLKKYYFEKEQYSSLALRRLNKCGLVDYYNDMVVTSNEKKDVVSYVARITKLGEYFYEVGLNDIDIGNG